MSLPECFVNHPTHTASQVLPIVIDDVEGTFVDGDDECDQKMTWFTTDVQFYWDKTFPKTSTDYPSWRVPSTLPYDR